jgi:cell division protein FtsB
MRRGPKACGIRGGTTSPPISWPTEPEALERIARDELGMVRSHEILFQFND